MTDSQFGYSIIELLVAMAVFVIIVPAATLGIWQAQDLLSSASYHSQAVNLAEATLEAARSQARINFANVKSSSGQNSIYHSTTTVKDLDAHSKEVGVTVTWQLGTLPEHKVELNTQVTDWLSAFSGDTCTINQLDWTRVHVSGTADFGTVQPTSAAARSNLVYVTGNSGVANDPDFFVVNVTNPAQPIIASRLNTGPGLSSITATGNKVYVGNTSINHQLQVINIADPDHPLFYTDYELPGNYADGTNLPLTLKYDNGKIYMGTNKNDATEFHVIDTQRNAGIQEMGGFEVNAGINDFLIQGNVAYLVSPDNEELKILDVSDPTNMRQVGGFNAPAGSGNGKSLAVFGSTIYFGRTIGNIELYSLNISNPLHPQISDSLDLNTSIESMIATPHLLFLGTKAAGKNLQIWDNTNPSALSFVSSLNLPGTITHLACGKDTLYVTTTNPNQLSVVQP